MPLDKLDLQKYQFSDKAEVNINEFIDFVSRASQNPLQMTNKVVAFFKKSLK
jgi:hypothetical protein